MNESISHNSDLKQIICVRINSGFIIYSGNCRSAYKQIFITSNLHIFVYTKLIRKLQGFVLYLKQIYFL